MSEWGHRIDVPHLGPGWVRMTKPRSSGTTRLADHLWIAPTGKKFRSEKQATAYAAQLASGAPAQPPAAGEKAAGAAKKKAEAAKPVSRSAKVPYNPPASRQLAPAAPALPDIVCRTCKDGHEPDGNAILLCDGPGCSAAYHMACLSEPLARVPEGDWLCPSCDKPPPRAELTMASPHNHNRQLQQSLHVVDGTDLGEWAVAEARRLRQQRPAGPSTALWLQRLPGRACLVSLPPKASGLAKAPAAAPPPRPGLVIDVRLTEPDGEVSACVWLGGRSQPTWVSTAPSSAACVYIGAELCGCRREPDGLPWPARAFRPLTKALLTPGGATSAEPGARAGVGRGKARGRGRGDATGRGRAREGAETGPIWLKFFGATGAPLLQTTSELLTVFPLAVEEPFTEASPALQVRGAPQPRPGPPLTPTYTPPPARTPPARSHLEWLL